MTQKTFFDEIPFVRAIACLLVVMIHTTARAYTPEESLFFNDVSLYLNQISRLGTPIFAVISAFLLTSSVINRGFYLKKFITSRFVKIVSPYIIWTFVYLMFVKYIQDGQIFRHLKQTFDYFALGQAKTHLYFIVTVIHFYILFPFLQLVRNRIVLLILLIVSLPINYLWVTNTFPEFINIFGKFKHVVTDRSFILNWISFFMFGSVLAYYWTETLAFVKKFSWLIYLSTVVLFYFIFKEVQPDVLLSSSRKENLVYIPVFVIFLIAIARIVVNYEKVYRPFRVIGDYSMGIYLVHPLILYFIEDFFPFLFKTPYLLLVAYVLTLIISSILMKIISLFPKSTFIVPIPKQRK
ncbi:acyltransferase [Thalassobacillus sp. CUG 92003]|uniref:acyltransferase n=1 Tax=Thalassobacillus sp. CUG 92003 TaxID=2736641 RepID=UPI0015E6A2CE|nr:acyltransferase [Thalassobacillus sp. CUG 92003]